MGLSKSKTKTTNDPWAPAQPYILNGLSQTQSVFDAQQPQLNAAAGIAQQAYNTIAPGAFGANSFVQNAQKAAEGFTSGSHVGTNPGASTYSSIQSGAQPNPATPYLTAVANSGPNPAIANMAALSGGGSNSAIPGLTALGYGLGAGGAGDAALGGLAYGPGAVASSLGGTNPATGYATGVAGGQYLNAQPSSQLYADTLAGKYLDKGNPYLQSIIDQTNANVTKTANQRFGAAGMGAGLSSVFGDVLTKNLANNEGGLRYQNYDAERNRQIQTAGQSDAVWGGERNRMQDSVGLLSSDYNAGQNRALSAAQSDASNKLAAAQSLSNGSRADANTSLTALGQLSNANNQQFGNQLDAANALGSFYGQDRASQLAAGQALGANYFQGQQDQISAAEAADSSYNMSRAQMLDALGLTSQLRGSEYLGIDPALNLLNTSAELPWLGVNALNGGVRTASNGYGTTTSTQSGGLGSQLLGLAGSVGAGWATGGFKLPK